MCKYCKRLKELKELDEKEYLKIINSWKCCFKQAEDIISDCFLLMDYYGFKNRPAYWRLHDRAVKLLDKTCVRR